ncbi:M28 family peptidase [Rhodohalobacter sp. 8-1]|uniref:M28 family peptidase n=1 Tax=Rhodohalobacter sp. 8-1 TaxID=3131972 RepID=UPI0030EF461C
MTRLASILLATLFIAFAGCSGSITPEMAESGITGESLLSHIEEISSDEFEGRAPASRGEDLTVNYLVDHLQRMGIEPGMPDGTYIQEFPLLGQRVDGESASITINTNRQQGEELEYTADFMAWPSNEAEQVQIQNADLLYVGYGIQAPEFGWNDYKDADVEGKVLVFKNSDPSHDPEIFEGDSRLYYGRWSYKFEKAAEMGALGAIIIHTTPTAGYPWDVVSNSWGRERFALKSGGDGGTQQPEFNGWFTQESSERLFSAAGMALDEMLNAANSPDFTPVSLEGVTLGVDLSATYSDMSSRNVIGKIEGSDPELSDQHVIFSTHYDHLGITTPVNGDSINNGAWDNASGVAAVLETADALNMVRDSLRRTVHFMFVGAEEMGLLGSRYWSQNPTVQPGKVSANFNLDSMQIFGETSDMVLVGYGRNTLTDIFHEHAQAAGRTIEPDPQPQQGFFYRSDHFSFARVGIPAIYPNPGRAFIDKPDNYNAIVDSVTAANYHSVSDEINDYWDMNGMTADTHLIFRTAYDVINRDTMMEWEAGDEFEAIREEMIESVE